MREVFFWGVIGLFFDIVENGDYLIEMLNDEFCINCNDGIFM